MNKQQTQPIPCDHELQLIDGFVEDDNVYATLQCQKCGIKFSGTCWVEGTC